MKSIFLLWVCPAILLTTLAAESPAQWLQTSGPGGGHIQCLAVSGNALFAGTADYGVFRSTNNGLTWVATSTGLRDSNVASLAVEASTVYAGTTGGVYISNDNGTTWAPAGLMHTYISTLGVIGGTILAGTETSMFRSTDNGASWTAVMTGENIQTIVAHGSTLFAGTSSVVIIVPYGVSSVTSYAGVFMSTDSGATWTSAGLFGAEVYSLAFMGNDLYASTYAGVGKVFLSTNEGVTWTVVDTGLTQFSAHLAVRGTNLFAGTWWNGVFLSTDNGAGWKAVNTGLMDTLVTSVLVNGTTLFAGTYSGGVFRSTNDGVTWTDDNAGLTNGSVNTLLVNGTNIIAGTYGSGVSLSTNEGASWTPANSGITSADIRALAMNSTGLFAGSHGRGLFHSTNSGLTWTHSDSGMPNTVVFALATYGSRLFAGTGNGFYFSNDNGTSWTAGNWGLPTGPINSVAVSDGGRVYSGTSYGIWFSTSFGATWLPTNFPNTIANGLVTSVENLYAGTNYSGIFLSTDIGTTWSAIDSGLTSSTIYCFAVSGTNIFAGTSSGVFLSTNGGTTWKSVSDGLPVTGIRSLCVSGTTLFAGTSGRSVFKRSMSNIVAGVGFLVDDIPGKFSLEQNYPNPFNPSTTIRYALPQRTHVTLTLCNTLGQQVAIMVDAVEELGDHSVRFDAARVASGVYFYRLSAGGYVTAKKLLIVR